MFNNEWNELGFSDRNVDYRASFAQSSLFLQVLMLVFRLENFFNLYQPVYLLECSQLHINTFNVTRAVRLSVAVLNLECAFNHTISVL